MLDTVPIVSSVCHETGVEQPLFRLDDRLPGAFCVNRPERYPAPPAEYGRMAEGIAAGELNHTLRK